MTISRVGTGTPNGGYPTVSGGILSTDTLVVCQWNNTSSAPSNPSGFATGATSTAGGSSPAERLSVKKAAGGESGAFTSAATKCVVLVYRGVDNTTPQDAAGVGGGSSTASTTMNVPAITTTGTNRMLIAAGAANAASTFTTPTLPANWTEVLDDNTVSPASCIDQLLWTGSGASDSGGTTTITQSSTRYAQAIIALRPATAPAQVGTVTPTADTGQVALAWSAPGDGGYPITDYVVQYRTNAGPGSWNTFTDGTSSSTGATVTGLTAGTAYDFQVAAVNDIGQGTYSAAVTATPTAATSGVALARSRARRRSQKRR